MPLLRQGASQLPVADWYDVFQSELISLVAYPLYCAIKGFCKRISGRNGGLHKAHGTLYRDAPSVSVH